MFRTMAGRTTRAFAAGALILSLTATTFAGSANAAPLADDKTDCSTAAHARNDAAQLLHTAWKAFDGDLKSLARDARKLQHETEKESGVLTTDARAVVASAKAELKGIASQAHSDIQAAVDLGTACKDEGDDTTVTPTSTTNNTSTTAPSDATAPADSTDGARTFDTSGLDSKYKDIVDQAIKDMQAVVDDARTAVLEMTKAAESKETTATDVEKVKHEVATATADREEAKTAAKDKSKNKSNAKSSHSGKGKGRK